MIDKINDEFIVDCTNNLIKERQLVYKFLVDNRGYGSCYLTNDFPIIVCNKNPGNSNWGTLKYYFANPSSKIGLPVYTFEQFKEIYLEEKDMKQTYTIEELRNTPIQIKVYSEEQAIKLAYAVGHKTDWKPFGAIYPIYCYLTKFNFPTWNSSENERKSDKPTTIEFNQIENFMEDKKIIGYRLIKPEYKKAALAICHTVANWENSLAEYDININQKNYIIKLTNAKVLDLWFEKVYEEEYKVGDWITITEVDSSGWLNGTSKRTFQIDGNPTSFSGGMYWEIDGGKALHAKFRKATPEEIQQVQKTIVKMYSSNKGEFEIEVVDGKAYYRKENKELSKQWIKDIINIFGEQGGINYPYKVEVESVRVGCMEGTKKSDWENVYKLLK